ncbi:hypothetical protein DFP72DRAFT_922082 [Ephemerocybe angulata]|uniref:F-box domain-containing protein n=1 Tax=Ephemerocybe angulata TaxID=980116 RepID=A0A8H6HI29_9AGAR|nr:hypothetical protein DFP72DRAFT_922082 [Tulosesus angulatus]
MVTTRRKSALAASRAAEVDYDQLLADGDFVEGGHSTRKGALSRPKAKRQKVATTATQTTRKGSANANPKTEPAPECGPHKDKSLLTMPMNVLLEILGLLSPKDLLNVTRTNKFLCKVLLAKTSQFVWVFARDAHSVPAPSADFTERRWAGLLYSGHCQRCGIDSISGIRKVDPFLRKRLCAQCKSDRYITLFKFKKEYPEFEAEILDYLPYTNVGSWSNGFNDPNYKYFWDPNIPAVAEEWESLKHAADMGSAAAKKAFTKWKETRIQWVKDILQAGHRYQSWANGQAGQSVAATNRAKRLEAATLRLIQLGYKPEDISKAISVKTVGIATGTPNVTDSIWAKLQPKLEPLVIEERDQRLSREVKSMLNTRMTVFKQTYDIFLSTLRPLERYQCPPAPFLRILPEVSALMNAANVVTVQHFQPIIDNMAEHLVAYQDAYKASVIATIPASEMVGVVDPFELARFVFSCQAGSSTCSKSMIGWEAIASHQCIDRRFDEVSVDANTTHQVVHDKTASAAASTLIQLVGLDPKVAKISDMDLRNARFVCRSCRLHNNSIKVHNWRSAVMHTTHNAVMHTYLPTTPISTGQNICPAAFCLGSSATTASGQTATLTTMERDGMVWSCNHCTAHIEPNRCQKKPDVLGHLRSEHAITNPQLSQDYFLNTRSRAIYDKPVCVLLPRIANCRCLQCPGEGNGAGGRRFILEGVVSHLRMKHHINAPEVSVDYEVDPRIPLPC